MNPREILSEYGTVVTCKVIQNQIVTIVLTEGFSGKGTQTFDFLNDCQELFPTFPNVETCITREGLAIVVLTRPKERDI